MNDAPISTSQTGTGPTEPTADDGPEQGAGSVQVVRLPSGTTLDVRTDSRGESITVRSAGGSIDLSIRLTDQGPVLSLKGVRLEIEAADAVSVNCREFAVNAREGLRLSAGDIQVHSDAEIRLQSAGSTFLDGDFVNLNCLDRTGYHDHVPEDALQEAEGKGSLPTAELPQADGG